MSFFHIHGSALFSLLEDHKSLYSAAAAKIDLLHDAFSQLSVGGGQVADNGVEIVDPAIDSFVEVEVCDASVQTSLQEDDDDAANSSRSRQRSLECIDESIDIEDGEESFRTVEVVDASLQTSLAFDAEGSLLGGSVNESHQSIKVEQCQSNSHSGDPSVLKSSLKKRTPAFRRVACPSSFSEDSTTSECLNESSYRQVEVVDASMQADFSLDFPDQSTSSPADSSSIIPSSQTGHDSSSIVPSTQPKGGNHSPSVPDAASDMKKSAIDAPTSESLNEDEPSDLFDVPLPKPFVPYRSPTGAPSLFGPKSSSSMGK